MVYKNERQGGLTETPGGNSSLALALHSSLLDILYLFVYLWCSLTGKWLLKQVQSQAAAAVGCKLVNSDKENLQVKTAT